MKFAHCAGYEDAESNWEIAAVRGDAEGNESDECHTQDDADSIEEYSQRKRRRYRDPREDIRYRVGSVPWSRCQKGEPCRNDQSGPQPEMRRDQAAEARRDEHDRSGLGDRQGQKAVSGYA